MLGWAAILVMIFYLALSENLFFKRLIFRRLVYLVMSSIRRSTLPCLSSPLNHELLQQKLRSVIESMLELKRISRTSSQMFSFLSCSQLNSYMLRDVIDGLFWKICRSRLTRDSLPASDRQYMPLSSKWVRLRHIAAILVTTSSSKGSHCRSKRASVSFSRPCSGRY